MKKIRIAYFLIFLFLLSSCGPAMMTKRDAYPQMYKEHPLSILVLPPMNETTAADAKAYYSTTLSEPLTLDGYYVYPIEVTSDIFKQQGTPDTEMMLNVPPQKFKQYFGADAVMYVKLLKWNTSYYVIGGNVTVGVNFRLVSTTTGDELWHYSGQITVDTTGGSAGGGWAALLVKVVTTAIKTATTDYVPIARRANFMTLATMPYGKYNPDYDKDMDMKVVLKSKIENNKTQ